MTTSAGDGLTCPVHPGEPAVAACVVCGRLVCVECRVIGPDGLTRCTEHATTPLGALDDEPAKPSAEPAADERPADHAANAPSADHPRGTAPEVDPATPEVNAAEAEPRPAPEPPADDRWSGPSMGRPSPGSTHSTGPSSSPPSGDHPVAVAAPHRPPESGPPPAVDEGPAPIPWEHPGVGPDALAFFRTTREALLGPTRYMGRIPWQRNDFYTPLLFALMAGIIGQVGLVGQSAFMPLPAPIALPGLPALPAWVALLLALPLSPVVLTLSLFVKAGLGHLLLRMAGQPPRPFEATFRVFAYAEVASLLLVVPMIGLYASRFYVIFLLLTGLRFAQGAGFAAALLAMLPTLVLQWVLV